MGHHRFQQQSQRGGLNLEGCINLEQERISRSRSLVHTIRFTLDNDFLQNIQTARKTGCRLYVPRDLLATLRDYTLIDWENRLQSGLTFCTYYRRGESEEALMRSVISLDGDILHQIRRDCLEHPNFCQALTSAHYWLIEQLMSQLRLGAFLPLNLLLNLLSWGLALLIAALFVILFIPEFLNNPWLLIAPLLGVWLLQIGLQGLLRVFLPAFRRRLLRWMLSGLLSHKPRSTQIARRILAWFVP
ncbi:MULTISPECIES: hypothetical protein [unclassified Coleofasciculus]|uniref:hypothetical protein n=1 Tax=unclassified Coleofasciculus TaxID=2692782 RepID=UPI00187EBBC9|nr:MULTISPECIES: hypothetical protein [unclassified Coleofasciculus]MBE9127019.1 hypothetical protein [Coleofasciculus sp. LEGE 07081]MBE9149126.1 hypothetical protein [Coleofasciculus sp. LEGE 07092]